MLKQCFCRLRGGFPRCLGVCREDAQTLGARGPCARGGGSTEAGFGGSGFFLSHGFPSPCSSGERRGLGALCAFQGMRLHFAKDVLDAARVRHQYWRFENLQELFPLLSRC